MFYGKLRHDPPDIIYDWGDQCCRADGRLLDYLFNYCVVNDTNGNNMIRELEARGYDIETIRFSIRKREKLRQAHYASS